MEIIDEFIFSKDKACIVRLNEKLYVSFHSQVSGLPDRIREGTEPEFEQVWDERYEEIVYVSKTNDRLVFRTTIDSCP